MHHCLNSTSCQISLSTRFSQGHEPYSAWIIPKPSPTPQVHGKKLSSVKPVPGAKKVRDCCHRQQLISLPGLTSKGWCILWLSLWSFLSIFKTSNDNLSPSCVAICMSLLLLSHLLLRTTVRKDSPLLKSHTIRSVKPRCLAVHTVHWTQVRQGTSGEAWRKLVGPGHIYSLQAGATAAQQTCCILSWLTQWTHP